MIFTNTREFEMGKNRQNYNEFVFFNGKLFTICLMRALRIVGLFKKKQMMTKHLNEIYHNNKILFQMAEIYEL